MTFTLTLPTVPLLCAVNPRKVAIVGSRKWPTPDTVRDYINALPAGTIIVTGGAVGVDTAAEAAAKARGLRTIIFRPDYKKYHPARAPLERNTLIVAEADEVVAFQFNVSSGTQDTIDKARKAGKPVTVLTPDDTLTSTPRPADHLTAPVRLVEAAGKVEQLPLWKQACLHYGYDPADIERDLQRFRRGESWDYPARSRVGQVAKAA